MSDVDNQDQQSADTSDQQAQGNWYDNLGADLSNNPTLQKYTSQEEANKGHLELAKSLGSERIAWPKDASDEAGWAGIDARRGVPEKPEGYDLVAQDVMEGVPGFDRLSFQNEMKSINASPAQATKLWENMTGKANAALEVQQKAFQEAVNTSKGEMMAEWGEAYDSKIQRGQAVIDNFAVDQAQKDFLTSTMAKDPNGMKFLAKLGDQFAEASIAGFQEKKTFTLTPEEARVELDQLKANPNYTSDDDRLRGPLVDRSNELMAMIGPGKTQRSFI